MQRYWAVGTIASPAVAETLRFSNVTSVSGKEAGVEFKRIVEEKTNGALEVKHFPDNQLGNDRVITESTIFGDIDIGVSSTSPLATLFPDLYAFDAPFLFLSPEDAYAKLDGETGQAILKTLEKKGLKGLAFWENGFRNFTNSKKAVAEPSDLDGMKIRTMGKRRASGCMARTWCEPDPDGILGTVYRSAAGHCGWSGKPAGHHRRQPLSGSSEQRVSDPACLHPVSGVHELG